MTPIGAGNVASDLLESKFKITYLTKVHRTASDSGILSDANTIREGKNPISQPSKMEIRGNLKDMFYAFRSTKGAFLPEKRKKGDCVLSQSSSILLHFFSAFL